MNNDIIDVLAGDPFYYNIINYLNSDDIYNLLQTCKHYKSNITSSEIKRQTLKEINQRFTDLFGNQTQEFKKIMKELECVLTGSFVLQSILKTYWEETDLDIYILGAKEDDKSKTLMDYFLTDKMGYKIVKTTTSYIEAVAGILEVRTYDKKDSPYKIQLIMVTVEDNLHNYVIGNFDFDICKNIYSIDKNNKETLFIHKINDILSKKTKFALNDKNRIGSTAVRCRKYSRRGFDFTNKDSLTYKDFQHTNILEIIKDKDADNDTFTIVSGDVNKFKEFMENRHCLYHYYFGPVKSYKDYIQIHNDKIIIDKKLLEPCKFGLCIIQDLCCKNNVHCHLDDENKNLIVVKNKIYSNKHHNLLVFNEIELTIRDYDEDDNKILDDNN